MWAFLFFFRRSYIFSYYIHAYSVYRIVRYNNIIITYIILYYYRPIRWRAYYNIVLSNVTLLLPYYTIILFENLYTIIIIILVYVTCIYHFLNRKSSCLIFILFFYNYLIVHIFLYEVIYIIIYKYAYA